MEKEAEQRKRTLAAQKVTEDKKEQEKMEKKQERLMWADAINNANKQRHPTESRLPVTLRVMASCSIKLPRHTEERARNIEKLTNLKIQLHPDRIPTVSGERDDPLVITNLAEKGRLHDAFTAVSNAYDERLDMTACIASSFGNY